MSTRACKGCSGEIPQQRPAQSRYCSGACQRRVYNHGPARAWKKANPEADKAHKRAWDLRNGVDGVSYSGAVKRRAIYGTAIPFRRGKGRFAAARALGYRSGLEVIIAKQLKEAGIPFEYESVKLAYITPAKKHTYKPDYILPNGIIIESKGLFTAADRQKHILLHEQHPDLDLRFVFTRSSTPINKGSKTTYADWCSANGFLYADKTIPQGWLHGKTITQTD